MEEKKEEVVNAATAEMAKVRSTGKVFKIAAIVLSALFVLLLCVVFFLYQKISGFNRLLTPLSGTVQDAASRVGVEGQPGIPSESAERSASPAPIQGGSALAMFTNAGEYARAAAAIKPEDGEAAAKALAKYADRPIVKDFLAELKKDPDYARALKEKAANDPMAMMASVQKAKGIQMLALKFAMRKDFMPLMMEVMNDPDMKPLLSKLPLGNMMPGAQTLNNVPSAAPVTAQPEASPAPNTETGEPMRLDSSVVQPQAPLTEPALKKKAPPLPGE